MSDETKPSEESQAWQMPEPVFQTTEGRAPGVPRSEAITDEIETASDKPSAVDISSAITEEMPGLDTVSKPGFAGSFLFILVTITALAIALVAALYYYFSTYRSTDTTF